MSRAEAAAPPAAPAAAAGFSVGRGLLLLAVVTLLWGVNWPIMHRAIEELPIWTFRAICVGGAAIGLLLIARLAGQSIRIPRGELRPLLLMSLFNVTIWHLASATGLAHLSAGRATIIAFTMPLWAALLAIPLLGERLSWTTLSGLLLGLAGMAALVLPDFGALLVDPVGPIAMLVAAMSWAVGTVGMKYVGFTMPVTTLTGWQLLLGGAPVMIGALLFDRGFDFAAVSAGAWLATAFSLVAATIFCHWAWFKLVRRFPAVGISVGSLAIPVVGVLASALGFGEAIGPEVLAALALVVGALFLVLILPSLRS